MATYIYVVLSWRRVGRDLCRRAFSSGDGLEAANEATDRLLTGRRESSQSTSSSASSSYKFSSSSSSKTKGRLSGTGLWTTRGLLPTFSGRSSGCCGRHLVNNPAQLPATAPVEKSLHQNESFDIFIKTLPTDGVGMPETKTSIL